MAKTDANKIIQKAKEIQAKKDKNLNIRIEPELIAELRKICEAEGVEHSVVVRALIQDFCEQKGKK